MKDQHIVELLENVPFHSLAAEQTLMIREHVRSCDSCRSAFVAARLASVVLQERSTVAVEPSPFFQTRVLAAVREQQSQQRVPVLWRLWKSAGVLVSSMALTTAVLAGLTFVVPGPTVNNQEAIALNNYSAEGVILDQNSTDEQVTDDQVLNTIYADDDEAK